MLESQCTCVTCGAEFVTPTRYLKRGRGRNCSRKCSLEAAQKAKWAKHHATADEWFWSKVDKSGGEDACWPWTGRRTKTRGGYGRLVWHGRLVGAHRMSLALVTGANHSEMFACHHCDNPPCCNPKHLFWGTPQDNTDDCVAKGRKRGAAQKIPPEECLLLRESGWSYSKLAERYGVNQASIGKLLNRQASLRARITQEQSNGRA